MKAKILVVDDEPEAVEVLTYSLKEAGFTTCHAEDGAKAIVLAKEQHPALILLDLMLPKVDGFEVCRVLRRDPGTAAIPIIMLTARTAEMDRVVGLEIGADDYVTKPFSPREIVIRIKKLLARTPLSGDALAPVRFGEIEIDAIRHEVKVAGEVVMLTTTEFNLLQILARNCGRVQTRDLLLQDVWGYDAPIETRTVDTHIRRLREKLGKSARLLETVRGIGYRLDSK